METCKDCDWSYQTPEPGDKGKLRCGFQEVLEKDNPSDQHPTFNNYELVDPDHWCKIGLRQ